MSSDDLKKLCRISGFEYSDTQSDTFSEDFAEIVGIMDKIKMWRDSSCTVTASEKLEKLREDIPFGSSLVVSGDISIGRVVQKDD